MSTPQAPQQPYYPPQPQLQPKKPWYRRWWAIVLGVFVVLAILGSVGGGADPKDTADDTSTSQTADASPSAEDSAPADDASPSEAASPKPKPKPSLTSGQKNAARSAEAYVSMSGFSRAGLIKQLKFEGYPRKDAAFAADYLHVDWKKEAAQSAKDYVSMSGFSRSGLITQLKFEGFTPAQAAYGADKAL